VGYNHVLDKLLGDFNSLFEDKLLDHLEEGGGCTLTWNPTTHKLTIAASGGGGGSSWGSITGTLSNQTDLSNALADKPTLTGVGATGNWGITSSQATALTTARTFSLSGIVTASGVTFDGTGNVSLATAIADSALTIAKTSGLQTALDGKAVTGHVHIAANVTDFSEAVDDRVAALLVQGSGITLTYDDSANTITVSATGGGGSDPWTYIKLASDFVTSSATAVDVTSMSFTPSASQTYEVEAVLFVQTVTTTVGPRPAVGWSTGLSGGAGQVIVTSGTTASAQSNAPAGSTLLAPAGGLPLANTSYPAFIKASFITSAAPSGTFRVQLATETALTNVTVKAGSWLKYRTI
jgi:hypothetical protein